MLVGGDDRVQTTFTRRSSTATANRIGAETKISTSTRPARYTRVASSTTAHTSWNTAFNTRKFAALANQVVQTATAGTRARLILVRRPRGHSAPSAASAPPVTPLPRMSVDLPANGARVPSNGFAVAGWAIDAAAGGSIGVDAVHVWAHPTSGAPAVLRRRGNHSTSRGRTSALHSGRRSFARSGFSLNATVPPEPTISWSTRAARLPERSTTSRCGASPSKHRCRVPACGWTCRARTRTCRRTSGSPDGRSTAVGDQQRRRCRARVGVPG